MHPTSKPFISIVSPVYKAEKLVDKLVEEVVKAVSSITEYFEIILVEDGSPDLSWEHIVANCEKDSRVKGIKLSRNFGQHNAIAAGLRTAKGEWVIVMDCDLQDNPGDIPRLFQKSQEGFDLVLARRAIRNDTFLKRLSSKAFYWVFSYLTDTQQDAAVANFGIYHKNVIMAINSMGDYVRVFPILVQWVGFKKAFLDVQHNSRDIGKSSYTLWKLIILASNMIISFSEKPLKLGLRFGLLIATGAFLFGVFNLIKYLRGDILVPGYASTIVSIWFLGGIIIAFSGLIGLYIGKIFEKVKSRPSFIASKKKNLENEDIS